MKETIQDLAKEYFNEMVANRRYLHENPELSFQETETYAYLKKQLLSFGINNIETYANTGILAILNPENNSGKTIALRADMDALPVTENTGLPFSSVKPGIMHACGHDIHMACLLGTARILKQISASLNGKVLLLFQPGEEKLPGGALKMIKDGLFDKMKPDLIVGQHVYPDLPAGQLGFRPGKYMASSDEIYITITGKGGHGAMPHLTPDTVLAASQLVVEMQQIVSRFVPAGIPSVLSFGNILASDGATNIIPHTVKLEGTFRTMDENWRKKAHAQMQKIVDSIAVSSGTKCEINIVSGYPVLFNHPDFTSRLKKYAAEIVGENKVSDLDIRMTSEDFAYFSQLYPSVFYRLGTGFEIGETHNLHSPKYDSNENALQTGSSTMAYMAWSFLK